MSPPAPSEEKRHYVAVLRHTLHAVRTRGQTIEFCRESALSEKSSVQKLVQDWSEGRPIAAMVAIDPEPVWWHLGDATDAHALRTDVEVRRFAGRLPHRLPGPLEVIGCKAADGRGISSEGEERWLLGVAGGQALAGAAAEAIERGIVTAALGSATLGGVAAAATALQLEGAGSVRLWAIGQQQSHVFTVGLQGIDAVEQCAMGFDAIFAAIEQVFGAKNPTEAARQFFSAKPDYGAAESLVSMLAPQLQSVLGRPPCSDSVSFACTGLTNRQAWFGRAMAGALGLSYWSPNTERYSENLQLKFPLRDSEDLPSLSLLGTLHLAATRAGGSTAWHPSWGLISRAPAAAAAQEIQPSVNSTVASARPPESPSVKVPSSANVPAPVRPPLISAREAASTANVPDARPEANGESKQVSPAAASLKERKTSTPPPRRGVRAEVSAVPIAHVKADGGPHPSSLTPAPLMRIPPTEQKSLSLKPASLSPVATEAVSGAVPAGPSISNPPPPLMPPAESKPSSPFPSSSGPATPPREPTVIVVRKSGYWPVVGIVLAVIGAGLWGKLYLDAEAVKTAAAQEKRTAEQAMETAEREIAAAVEQVRRLSEQAAQSDVQAREQAARADLQARELTSANAREIERIRIEMEAARREAVAEARREAEEQTRRLLAPQLDVARAAATPGILKIASVPAGADVYVNGRLAERAPASIEGLPPGRHSIRLALAGHVTHEITADIVGAKTTDVGAIKLERTTGAVMVSSSPDQLEFSIRPSATTAGADPQRHGRTPAQLNDLPTGEYVVQFKRAGWPERTERVTIERGATKSVATTFQGGTVIINSSPTGATVIQGGLLLGRTPLTLGDTPPREVAYELSVPGYEPLKVGGTVVGGRELELNGTLLNLERLVSADEVRTPPRVYFSTPLNLGRVPRSAPPYITVSFVVLPNGSLQEVKVLDAVDKKIERRSVEAIAKWKFYPGVSHAGYPVKVRMSMPIPIASRG